MKNDAKKTKQDFSWFSLHAWLGYKLCIFMVVICATGTLATISHEIDWLINPMIRVDPMEAPIQWDEMQKNFEESHPSSRLSYLAAPLYPSFATIGLMQTKDGKNRRIFFNPYSGEIIGDLPWYASFQRVMRDLHRFLLIPINLSLYLVSSFGFVLLVSLITGLFVYKKWWSGFFKLRFRRSQRIFFGDSHRLLGVWSIPFLFVISLTGGFYFIERASADLNFRFYEPSPHISVKDQNSSIDHLITIESAISIAKQNIPGLEVSLVILPRITNARLLPYRISGQVGTILVRERANRVFINPIDGTSLSHFDSRNASLSERLYESADPLHFGNFSGLVSKVIYFLFGLFTVSMSITGMWMWKNRQLNREQRGLEVDDMGFWKPISLSVVGLGTISGLVAIVFYTT